MEENDMQRKMIIVSLVIVTLVVLLGIILGFIYSSLPGHNPQESKISCETAGGDWSDEEGACLLSYKEAGEVCTDGGQCISGVCFPSTLTEEQRLAVIDEPLENVTGTCYSENLITGCVDQIVKGVVSKETLCFE